MRPLTAMTILALAVAAQHLVGWMTKSVAVAPPVIPHSVSKKATAKKYYNGTILANIDLNDKGSNKQTYHIEIATEEVVEYEPGDAIGIFPKNRFDVVERIISITGIDGNSEIATSVAISI